MPPVWIALGVLLISRQAKLAWLISRMYILGKKVQYPLNFSTIRPKNVLLGP